MSTRAKVRTCDDPDDVLKLTNELQVAVHRGGGSIDPQENHELRARLSTMLLPYVQVHRILKDCELSEKGYQTYGLPMDYGRQRVAMVLKVRTNDLAAVKRRMANFLRQNKSRFFDRHIFEKRGIIEANYSELKLSRHEMCGVIGEDSEWSLATGGSCILDYENQIAQFRCQWSALEVVTENLRQCGYKIIHTDLGYYTYKPLVNLSSDELRNYLEFVEQLKQDEDVVWLYDNVRY